MFESRAEALDKLIEIIDKKLLRDSVILTLSEFGVFYAEELALRFGITDGDYMFIEGVKSPINKETTLAVVSETKDYVLINELIESFEITDDFIFNEIERVYEETILEKIHKIRGGEGIISLEDRDVFLIDEGANTGLTLLCAIKSCLNKKVKSINVAMPVIATDTAEMIEKMVDNAYFVKRIEDFVDVRFYFKEYE
jgi:putative phosphoribosyl transferase